MTSTVGHWVLALRPRTLGVGLAPVAIGTGIAVHMGVFDVVAAILAAVGALLLQIVSNLANDYYDFKNGADNEQRIGPTRATQAGLITPAAMRRAFIGVLVAAIPVGVALTVYGGWPIVAIGVAGGAAAILYTGGPAPLGYLGFGDVLVLIFFGPVAVAGTVLVQAGAHGAVSADTAEALVVAAVAGLTPGLLATNVLVVNNLRDRFTDAVAGKKTLAVRFGARFARAEYWGSLVVGLSVVVALVLLGKAPLLTLGALVTVPIWGRLGWRVSQLDQSALNPYLGRTAAALVATSVLLSLGWWMK